MTGEYYISVYINELILGMGYDWEGGVFMGGVGLLPSGFGKCIIWLVSYLVTEVCSK
jgi:hypothetical protein